MSSQTEKAPWRNGLWFSEQLPVYIWDVNGERMVGKNMISLDYPELEGHLNFTIKYGDFGPARKEVSDITGVDNYNFELTAFGFMKSFGYLNESGTELTAWGTTNSIEIIKWMSPKEIDKLKAKREDINTPR